MERRGQREETKGGNRRGGAPCGVLAVINTHSLRGALSPWPELLPGELGLSDSAFEHAFLPEPHLMPCPLFQLTLPLHPPLLHSAHFSHLAAPLPAIFLSILVRAFWGRSQM